MRILSIGPALGRGGTERALETFSLGYQRLGHDVAVLAWEEGGPRRTTLERAGIEVFVGGEDLEHAVEAAEAFGPDLLHIHRVGVAWDAETALLRRLRTRDRRVLETNVFGRVDRSEAGEYIDVHLLLSRWCLWRWRRWLGRASRPTVGVVVPNPVDIERFGAAGLDRRRAFRQWLGIPEHAFVCGRVGQRSAVKWHPELLRAFEDLARSDPAAHLILLGLPSSLHARIRALPPGVRRRVIDLPLVDSDETLSDLYSSLDCFVHAAAVGETFGYVLAEAMLCGCPVVTASTPHVDNSQVEIVGHMAGGIVTGSMDGLSTGLQYLHGDPRLRDQLRARLREHVVSRFEAQSVAALAARIGMAALETGERAVLQRQLSETEGCVLHVDDETIGDLINQTLGPPRMRDLLEMRVRHWPAVQKAIDARLTRHLNQSTSTRAHVRLPVARVTVVEPAGPRPAAASAAVTVSAIMPAYNTGCYIGEAIESVLAQSMTDWELVIVDDGSNDDTGEVLARYVDPRIRVITCEKNRGRSAARNLALEHATGRYIAICDSDDISVPTRFAQQVAYLDTHPGVDVVSGQLAHFAEASSPRMIVQFPLTCSDIRERLAVGRMGLAHGASMLRAECFRRYGGYCLDVPSAEDLELFCRIADRCTFASLPAVLVAYRHKLPDPFSEWMSAARHQRYAWYRLQASAAKQAQPLAYDEFARQWEVLLLNHTVDLARFTIWSIRSRVAYRG